MRRRGRPPYPDILTPREQEVLDLLRRGRTNQQIAERLGISIKGAEYHVSEILGKLGVSDRHEAARLATAARGWSFLLLPVGMARRLSFPRLLPWLPAGLAWGGLAVLVMALAGGLAAMKVGGSSEEPAAGAPTPGAADEWSDFRQRPLALPILTPGEPCPAGSGRTVSAAYGPAVGDGPFYAVGLGTDGVLRYAFGTGGFSPPWGGQKMAWVSNASYGGPALIRGRQLDGPNELRFEGGADPPDELRLPIEAGAQAPGEEPGWRNWPTYTRVKEPGCYAYQVDGLGFTEIIVFRAEPEEGGTGPGAAVPVGSLAYVRDGDVWLLDNGQEQQLTSDGQATGVRWSPDGRWLVVDGHSGEWVARAVSPDGGSSIDVITGDWSPDGSRVAGQEPGSNDLLVQPVGGEEARITGQPQQRFNSVKWSPDGQWLAAGLWPVTVARDNNGPPQPVGDGGIVLIRPDGSDERTVYAPGGWPEVLGWSPDGQVLLVWDVIPSFMSASARSDGGRLELVRVADGQSFNAGDLLRPEWVSWSPDARSFVATIGGGRETYVEKQLLRVDVAEGRTADLSADKTVADLEPAWSPDGSRIAFARGPAAAPTDVPAGPVALVTSRRIWTVAPDGSDARQLTDAPGWADESPRWSADGTQILFVRWRVAEDGAKDEAQLWLMNADGADQRQVADLGLYDPGDGQFQEPLGYYGTLHWEQRFAWWQEQ